MTKAINKKWIIFFIMLLNIPAAMSIDEYVPSLPSMVHWFHSSIPTLQLTLTLYMLGMGVAQFLCGPLSDRFGRKPVLLFTVVIYLVGSALAVFSTTIPMLLTARFIQGAGMGCCAMICPALMGDSLSEKEISVVSTYFGIVYALIPVTSPVIGGYLQHYFGWQANFVFLFGLGAIVFITSFFKLPETHKPTEEHKLDLKKLVPIYLKIISNKKYLGAVICSFFSWTTVINFSLIGPFVLQDHLGLSAVSYGHYVLLIGVAFLIGSCSAGTFIKKFGVNALLAFGIWLALISSIIQAIIIGSGIITIASVIIPSFFVLFGIGLSFPCYFGKAANVFKENVGIASALIGCLILIGAVLVTLLMTVFHLHTAFELALVYIILCGGCIIISFLNKDRAAQLSYKNP